MFAGNDMEFNEFLQNYVLETLNGKLILAQNQDKQENLRRTVAKKAGTPTSVKDDGFYRSNVVFQNVNHQ